MSHPGPSPLVGSNTNVRHRGRVFHVQTEDSGLKNPNITTHLFADGGRIVATKKANYAAHVGDENYVEVVRRMMQAQHKEMFISLRNGEYDDEIGFDETAKPEGPRYKPLEATMTSSGASRTPLDELALKSLDEIILGFLASDDAR